ncbi:MAG: Sucrase/ferredoxin-like-domain-containing protein [Benniella sp.]|nr:MAG: Sucrase/ferredoxin-like-domain-containing protein [Benniella sp.]
MKPYTRHVLISTGREDWPAHIDEDKDSLAPFLQKAIDDGQERLKEAKGGDKVPRIVLTNSSRMSDSWEGPGWEVIILPDHIVVDHVTPDQCDDFFEAFLKPDIGTIFSNTTTTTTTTTAATGDQSLNTTTTTTELAVEKDGDASGDREDQIKGNTTTTSSHKDTWSTIAATGSTTTTTTTTTTMTTTMRTTSSSLAQSVASSSMSSANSSTSSLSSFNHSDQSIITVTAGNTTFTARKWQRRGAVMICSHKKRDKRCGVTAPYLKKAFNEILLSKDMYGNGEDDVEIWMVSHIGGHKFAGNVIVHRREGMAIWYGRVEPCHARAIVDTTIEKGEVIRELYRGSMVDSFNPSKKKMAW